MSDADLDELQRLHAAATPPPWHVESWNTEPNGYLYGPAPPHGPEVPPGLMKARPPVSLRYEDAGLVAATRNALPALLAEVRRLKAENERMRHNAQATLNTISGPEEAPDPVFALAVLATHLAAENKRLKAPPVNPEDL